MRLSICIATLNRAEFIGETLAAILPQLTPEVEVVVVDGASTDATAEVVGFYAWQHPAIDYRRETENCGVDRDFDKAIQYARGDYCWLMSDDDILVADAIATVLLSLEDQPDLVVVNAEVCTRDLSMVLKHAQLDLAADREFGAGEHDRLFTAIASYSTFIGAVIIRRAAWLSRDRASYFGSFFGHVGVIFQEPPLSHTRVLARPLVRIRYGNAQWTGRAFEIWTDKWPQLVWSLQHFPARIRAGITPERPARNLKPLLWYRALGGYGPAEFRSLKRRGQPQSPLGCVIARLPARFVNAAVAAFLLVRRHADARVMLYDLVLSPYASRLARWGARRFRFPETER